MRPCESDGGAAAPPHDNGHVAWVAASADHEICKWEEGFVKVKWKLQVFFRTYRDLCRWLGEQREQESSELLLIELFDRERIEC